MSVRGPEGQQKKRPVDFLYIWAGIWIMFCIMFQEYKDYSARLWRTSKKGRRLRKEIVLITENYAAG